VDAGFLGLASLVAIFIIYFIQVWRMKNAEHVQLVSVICIMLHAVFDIDLLFPVMTGVLLNAVAGAYRFEDSIIIWKPAVKSHLLLMHAILLLMAIGAVWIGSGYAFKEQALRYRSLKEWEKAIEAYSKAERLLPWSHSIPYEKSNVYVELGNSTLDHSYYNKAYNEMKKALILNRKKTLYHSRLEEINNNL
jgi:tetratricopeptide (TPR) repeat protein